MSEPPEVENVIERNCRAQREVIAAYLRVVANDIAGGKFIGWEDHQAVVDQLDGPAGGARDDATTPLSQSTGSPAPVVAEVRRAPLLPFRLVRKAVDYAFEVAQKESKYHGKVSREQVARAVFRELEGMHESLVSTLQPTDGRAEGNRTAVSDSEMRDVLVRPSDL